MTQQTNEANADAGTDYGPGFDQDVGAILKLRLLTAIATYRTAEQDYTVLNAAFMDMGDRWSEAQDGKTAARDELVSASTAWESWERQQLQKRPQTPQEPPGATEGADPLKIDVDAFMRP